VSNPSPQAFYENGRPFRVTWGWCSRDYATFADFETALDFAAMTLRGMKRKDEEPPAITNTLNEDIETDGLTTAQREACEALGLEVRKP